MRYGPAGWRHMCPGSYVKMNIRAFVLHVVVPPKGTTTRVASFSVVLVLGATGGIGLYVCRELLDMGFKVRGFTRQPAQAESLLPGAGVEWIQGDLNTKADIAPAMKGVKKVIFAAGAHGSVAVKRRRAIPTVPLCKLVNC